MLKQALSAALLCIAAATAVARPVDEGDPNTMPTDGLALYKDYRPKLVERGWKPVPGVAGEMYGFPEVTCGNAVCDAGWRRPDGRTGSFNLWPSYDGEVLILLMAPDYDGE